VLGSWVETIKVIPLPIHLPDAKPVVLQVANESNLLLRSNRDDPAAGESRGITWRSQTSSAFCKTC